MDTHLVEGTRVDGSFDSLVAKVITHSHSGFEAALRKAQQAARETVVSGVETNVALLGRVLAHDDLTDWSVTTQWFDASGIAERASTAAGDVDGVITAEMPGPCSRSSSRTDSGSRPGRRSSSSRR